MNQRQTLPKPRSARSNDKRPSDTGMSLPPVLFSLPDLSEPRTAEPPKPAYQATLASAASVGRELPHVLSTPIHPQDSKYSQDSHRATSSNVLNAAIGFLAFATLLIGAKLYSDHRVAERARASEQPQRMTTVAPTAPKTASPIQSRGPSQNPGGNGNGNGNGIENGNRNAINAGPQQATYETPIPTNLPQPTESRESSNKAVLEISDPVVSASYPAQAIHGSSSPRQTPAGSDPIPSAPMPSLEPIEPPAPMAQPNSIPRAPYQPQSTSQPPASQSAIPQSTPALAVSPSPIPATSLNTRDMILLRQGKSIDLYNRDPARETKPVALHANASASNGTQLTGETYPPVRQRYEPISVPPMPATYGRPTSMEVPTPPKPYEPIGITKEDAL